MEVDDVLRMYAEEILMDEATRKAAVLIEALPYIQRFRGAIVVVKLGGAAMEDPEHVEQVLEDITFMECVGMKVVIVHGGGKEISRGMEQEGIEARFIQGLRVTCERSIRVVEQVLKRDINPRIVNVLKAKGALARSLHGEEVLRVKRVSGRDPVSGAPLDWGFVGEPGEVNVAPVRQLLAEGVIPVITPLGMGPDGNLHNVNADVAASAIAKALPARKLAFLSDVPGLLRDQQDPASLISTLRLDEVAWMFEEGIITGGMLPKISSCIEALEAGVCKVHLIDGRQKHSLLLEIFTDQGVGTEIVAPENL